MIHLFSNSLIESWYEQTVALDGVDYLFRFMWSERERRWYMDMETADGTALATGVKVVADHDLLAHLTSDLRPPGILTCVDHSGEQRDPDLRDLGARVRIWYIDEENCYSA
jgi:hypothetical protein